MSSNDIRVLNLARFIAIKGLRLENDISLKIYYYLRQIYGVESLFIKSVIKIPYWAALLKKSLKKSRTIFKSNNYVDEEYDIRVKFFEEQFYLMSKINVSNIYKIPFQYKFLKAPLEKEIERFKPQLVHAHTVFPEGYYAYKIYLQYSIPYIITLRGEYNNNYESDLYGKILKNANQIHTPSASLFADLNDDYEIRLQPHPLESKWLEDAVAKQFESLNLITVSRLLQMKNIDIVLKVVQILHQKGFKVTYTIVGDGNYRQELEEMAYKLGINDLVNFKGYRSHEEIKEYYSRSNIFVMLSRPETYGRVYFEAAAQGLVVIGSKNTGAHGHLTEDEGIFIEESVENLLDVLVNTKKEEFSRISKNAKKRVFEFSHKKIVNEYYQIIKEALKNNMK